jgi:activating signal cointegrator complex subunit 1
MQLRTTLINTIYRTPKSLDRIPFDYLGVLGSSAVTDISAGPTPEWLTRALARRDASSKGPGAVTGTDEAEPTSDASSGELIRKMENTTKRPQHQIPAWPVRVDLGTWDIDELQMCDVYSRGPEGEYVPVHSISLV